jgi:hypothetical protein
MSSDDEPCYSPNRAIDRAIKEMMPCFSSKSQRRMHRAILDAKRAAERNRDENTDAAARHIFREFIPAAALNRAGFRFEYEEVIQGTRPDWLDTESRILLECYTYERGGSTTFIGRTASAVGEKHARYGALAKAKGLQLAVAVYLDFLTGECLEDCRGNLVQLRQVFDDNINLWALVFFTETHVVDRQQQYGFLSLFRDSSHETLQKWPFPSLSLQCEPTQWKDDAEAHGEATDA